MSSEGALLAGDFAAAVANTAPCVWRDGADHLPDVTVLQALVDVHGLPADGLKDRDVLRARALRDVLRAPFEADSDTACLEAIDALLAQLSPTPRLHGEAGSWRISLRCPSGLAIDDVLAASAFALGEIVVGDGRRRLHHCSAPTCRGVFLDTTRNRSRRFCMPELCGNRANVAAHRRRARDGSATRPQ